jgi:AraC-like DNA-binding protein
MSRSLGVNVAPDGRWGFGEETLYRGGVFLFAQRCQVLAGTWVDVDEVLRLRSVLEVLELTPSCATPQEQAVLALLVQQIADQVLPKLCGSVAPPRKAAPVFAPAPDCVAAAVKAIAASHSSCDTGLDSIAAEACVSRWYLSRELNRRLGRGFYQCLHAFRVLRAVVLLRSTRLSVKEIAAAVGYSWTSALDKQFGAWLHMTPTEFRSVPKILLR